MRSEPFYQHVSAGLRRELTVIVTSNTGWLTFVTTRGKTCTGCAARSYPAHPTKASAPPQPSSRQRPRTQLPAVHAPREHLALLRDTRARRAARRDAAHAPPLERPLHLARRGLQRARVALLARAVRRGLGLVRGLDHVAQHRVPVAAPAPDFARGRERERVVLAGGDGDDALRV